MNFLLFIHLCLEMDGAAWPYDGQRLSNLEIQIKGGWRMTLFMAIENQKYRKKKGEWSAHTKDCVWYLGHVLSILLSYTYIEDGCPIAVEGRQDIVSHTLHPYSKVIGLDNVERSKLTKRTTIVQVRSESFLLSSTDKTFTHVCFLIHLWKEACKIVSLALEKKHTSVLEMVAAVRLLLLFESQSRLH